MKQLILHDPAVASELAVIADRRSGPDPTTARTRARRRWGRRPPVLRARRS